METLGTLPYRWCVYRYDGEKFTVVSVHQTVPAALVVAETQIHEVCKSCGCTFKYNGVGDTKAFIAERDGKIYEARLVKAVQL